MKHFIVDQRVPCVDHKEFVWHVTELYKKFNVSLSLRIEF